jgi:hypothetical protein
LRGSSGAPSFPNRVRAVSFGRRRPLRAAARGEGLGAPGYFGTLAAGALYVAAARYVGIYINRAEFSVAEFPQLPQVRHVAHVGKGE